MKLRSGRLIWCGEHWVNGLRPSRSDTPSAWVSLFHTRYSPAGEGNVAQIVIAEQDLDLIATDNADLAPWITDRFFTHGTMFNASAPVVAGRFSRAGSSDKEPSWTIETEQHRIVATWQVTDPPVIADGSFRAGTQHFTLLFFVHEATVEVDGNLIDGQPYPRDIWESSIGGMRSSAVFALAETLLEIA